MIEPFDPEAAARQMLAAGAEPLEPYTNANTRWRCRCLTCGNEITPWFGNIRSGHHPCRFCASKRSAAAQRTNSEIAMAEMRAAGVEPLEPYVNTASPWRSRCLTCDKEVAPRLATVRRGSQGCRHCAAQQRAAPTGGSSE